MDWTDHRYLAAGTARQKAAHAALIESGIMEHLRPFTPVLTGTIPLGIDLPESDLDILCEVHEPDRFEAAAAGTWGHLPDYRTHRKPVGGLPTVLIRFTLAGFPFELFGQPQPVSAQNGYRHMLVEARLLALAGPEAAAAIRGLKAGGLKTEPAFAHYFGLEGDPYEALLALFHLPDEYLRGLACPGQGG